MRVRRSGLCLSFAALTAVHCGPSASSPSAAANTTVNANTAYLNAPRSGPDTSEVTRPDNMVMVLRVPPFQGLAGHIARLTGLGPLAESVLKEIHRNVISEPSLADVADTNAPLDVAWVIDRRRAFVPVISFAAPAIDSLEAVLAEHWKLDPIENGMMALEPLEQHDEDPDADAVAARPHMRCLAAPTPNVAFSAVVCVERWEAGGLEVLRAAAPYMARTLTRTPVASDTVTFEMSAAPVTQLFGRDAAREIDALYARLDAQFAHDTSGPMRLPVMRAAMTRLSTDVFDTARALLRDARTVHSTLHFGPSALEWSTTVDLAPGDPRTLLHGFARAIDNQPTTPAAALEAMPAGGMIYATASLDDLVLKPALESAAALVDASVTQSGLLSPADAQAVHDALHAWSTPGRSQSALSMGTDDAGRNWFVGWVRDPEHSAPSRIAAMRAVVDVMERPAVTRAYRTLMRSNRTSPQSPYRTISTTGLPAGAWAFSRMVDPKPATSSRAAGTATPATPPTSPRARTTPTPRTQPSAPVRQVEEQYLLVPEGDAVLFLMGRDVRALYAQVHAAHEPGLGPQQSDVAPGALRIAILPAGLPASLRVSNPSAVPRLESMLRAMPDQGRTPMIMSVDGEQNEHGTRYTLRLVMDRATLIGLKALAMGAPAPTAPTSVP